MPRTRSRTTEASGNNVTIQTSSNGGSSWSNYITVDCKSADASAQLTIDEVTPQYGLRSKNGEVIMNPFESWSSSIVRSGAYGYRVRRVRISDGALFQDFSARAINGMFTSQFRHSRPMIADRDQAGRAIELNNFGIYAGAFTSIEQSLLAAALEKATAPDALALVTAAEFDKTADMFVSAAASVKGMLRIVSGLSPQKVRELNDALRAMAKLKKKHLMKGLLRSLDKRVASAASSWLGYRYGVMATIYDVESWIDASNTKAKRTRFTAKREHSFDSGPTITTDPNWQGFTQFGPMVTSTRRLRKTLSTAGVLIGSKADLGIDRYGVNRLASTMWELIPYSFVLDWVCDAGTRLAAFEGNFLSRPLGTWVSHAHYLTYQHSYEWSPQGGVIDAGILYQSSGLDTGVVVESMLYRTRVPNPKLGPIPVLNVKLNNKRLADASALLVGFTKELRKAVIRKTL